MLSWCSGGAGGIPGVAMNRLKQDVLDSCEVGLAGKRVLEQTIENVKENWTDPRRAKVVVRQLDAVAQSLELQATTVACKIGMAFALKHRMKTQCQRPASGKYPSATDHQLYFEVDQCRCHQKARREHQHV